MDTAVKVKLAEDIIAIVENYDTWVNLDNYKDEVWNEITQRLIQYGVELG
jgi:hypothetical protein